MLTSLKTKNNPFDGKRVAVIGDVMVDRFIYGDVDRISPEAPVPVVKVSRRETHLGGAANVAANLKSLGAEPILIGRIGDDEYGKVFKKTMAEAEIDASHIVVSAHLPTISKCRIIARSQQMVRFDEEEVEQPATEDLEKLKAQLSAIRKEADVIVVSDYAKGLINLAVMDHIKELWAENGHILIDPKPQVPEEDAKYNGVTMIKPNLGEASAMLSRKDKPRENATVAQMAKDLLKHYNLEYTLITRSGDGMTLVLNDGSEYHLMADTQEVVDVSGAGDTVIATFASSIAAGLTPLQAGHLANLSGAIVVAKLGTASITWAELQAAI